MDPPRLLASDRGGRSGGGALRQANPISRDERCALLGRLLDRARGKTLAVA